MLKRVKRRYLALKIDSDEVLDSKEVIDAVWSTICKLYGEHGASRTGLMLISYDTQKRLAVVRTVHDAVGMVRVAIASITKIQDKPAAIHVLRVSGTIKALYKKI